MTKHPFALPCATFLVVIMSGRPSTSSDNLARLGLPRFAGLFSIRPLSLVRPQQPDLRLSSPHCPQLSSFSLPASLSRYRHCHHVLGVRVHPHTVVHQTGQSTSSLVVAL